ncbi:MAG: GyrI-like domain-containing protein [Candidatus Neomarinimicrobiota bacterium]
MKRVDFKREMKKIYFPTPRDPELVTVPAMNFLMIDGEGDPNKTDAYQAAIDTLYAVSYALKFAIKYSSQRIDYIILPLETLWWADDMTAFELEQRDEWKWTAMIRQPELITGEMVTKILDDVREKKNPPALDLVRFESLDEGQCVQIMHIGPYSTERPTVKKLHRFATENNYGLRGKHHEIYLSDVRRASPENLKTVIRQPVAPRQDN